MAFPALSRTFARVPASLWSLPAVLCGGLTAFAFFLEFGEGSASPGVRLAVALYGCLAVSAAKRAKWKLPRLYYKPWMGQVVLCTVITACIVITLLPVFIVGRRKAKESHAAHLLKTSGGLILEYAKSHGGKLPSEINPRSIPALLEAHWDKTSDNPFIDPYTQNPILWRHALSGRKIDRAKQLDRIIMGYSPKPVVDSGRLVCFLDGHVHWFRESDFKEKLREQPRLLSGEERVQQKTGTKSQ